MKSIYYDRVGLFEEVLCYDELEIPPLGPTEVLVKIEGVGINPADVKRISGIAPSPRLGRLVPGDDGAGVIVEVGASIDQNRRGERVWLFMSRLDQSYGTASTYVVLPAHRAVHLPGNISFEEGACLGVPAITAYYAVFSDGPIRNKTVLIHGGAGAVGNAAVQLAKWGGARVISTVSNSSKEILAYESGADKVINYKETNVVNEVLEFTGGTKIDRIIDVAFGMNVDINLSLIKENGIISTYSSDKKPLATLPVFDYLRKNITVHFIIIYTLEVDDLLAMTTAINSALIQGKLKPFINLRLPLSEYARAATIVSEVSGMGNLVLIP